LGLLQVTKPLTTVTAPPGQQVQIAPVYSDDGTNSLQGIGEEEVLTMTVLKPNLTVGSPSQLQGEVRATKLPLCGSSKMAFLP
jgi:hypothetical protein